MLTSKYFKLEELLYSHKAISNQICNLPSWEAVEHLNELALLLDDLREHYGKPIYVTSGFRCEALNTLVGGVRNSVHQLGYAADIVADDQESLKKFIVVWAKGKGFDQIILEKNKVSEWIHVGLYDMNHHQRCQVFKLAV